MDWFWFCAEIFKVCRYCKYSAPSPRLPEQPPPFPDCTRSPGSKGVVLPTLLANSGAVISESQWLPLLSGRGKEEITRCRARWGLQAKASRNPCHFWSAPGLTEVKVVWPCSFTLELRERKAGGGLWKQHDPTLLSFQPSTPEDAESRSGRTWMLVLQLSLPVGVTTDLQWTRRAAETVACAPLRPCRQWGTEAFHFWVPGRMAEQWKVEP